ncbi:patatin-like phospholipase family protein [Rhizobium sp. ZPR3]|uniref:Patatin-like phospholipase family protein n=2 Tax=unclassified Rhizobium TaxID=2613769 RepID=A0AAU7SQN3_9HYPH
MTESASHQPRASHAKTIAFADVLSHELGTLRAPDSPTRPIIGAALSGGGIRSAAFSLGLLQALGARDLFRKIDYLSTVSGGGYTGSSLVAAMTRNNGAFPFGDPNTNSALASATDISDNEMVRGLRNRCRYLMPNGAFDLVISLSIIARGLMVNVVFVLFFVLLAAIATLAIYPDISSLPAPDATKMFAGYFRLTKIALPLLGGWLVIWALWRSIMPLGAKSQRRSDPGSLSARFTAIVLVLVAAIAAAELQVLILYKLSSVSTGSSGGGAFDHVWAWLSRTATALMVGTGAFAVFWRWLVGFLRDASKDSTYGAMIKTAIGKAVLFVLAAALPALIYICYLMLTQVQLKQRATPLVACISDLQIFRMIVAFATFLVLLVWWNWNFGPPQNSLCDGGWWRSLGRRDNPKEPIWRVVAVIVSSLAVIGTTTHYADTMIDDYSQYLGHNQVLPLYVLTALFCACLLGLFSANANSLNRLYRDRLDEAFELGRLQRYHGGEHEAVRTGQTLKLSELNRSGSEGGRFRPYPIINTAMNMEGSTIQGHRSADFFMFTPDYVGSRCTGYVATKDYEKPGGEPRIDLATATAISGAAVSSLMGRAGVPILGPTLALLNIRLGYWAHNPRFVAPERQKSRIRDWKIFYLLAEIFGRPSENSNQIYLTDGGHIENTGVYELLKRRCELIIVADAEADPAMSFASLVDVERFARIDLGVRFDLPFQAMADSAIGRKVAVKAGIRPTPACGEWNHGAIGRIFYPDGKVGYILYVKAAMTGDEPSYVLDYERRYPRFPHEPTSDQFFTEEQFEAYRALGFHSLCSMLDNLDGTERAATVLQEILRRLTDPVEPKIHA